MSRFLDALKNRRSIYALGGGEAVPRAKITEIAGQVMLHTPSAFNAQSTRIALLFGEHHAALWALVLNALAGVTSPAQLKKSAEKVNACFASGYGTALFFEDDAVVEGLQSEYPAYADRFPVWAQHANAMHQLALWTALEDEGLGASLQHYNPLIDDAVRARWDFPAGWRLVAQMPFGQKLQDADEKSFLPLEGRLRIF